MKKKMHEMDRIDKAILGASVLLWIVSFISMVAYTVAGNFVAIVFALALLVATYSIGSYFENPEEL